jgi:hypothetical protein
MSSVVKEVTANGEKVSFTVVVNGDPYEICYNAQVALTIPDGVTISGPSNAGSSIINVPVGFFKSSDKTWYMGDLAAGAQVQNTFEFTVNNIELVDENDNRFLVVATLTSACTETDATDNVTILTIEVVDPCTQVSLSIGVDDDATSVSSSDLSIG